jgi:hypothetical protein
MSRDRRDTASKPVFDGGGSNKLFIDAFVLLQHNVMKSNMLGFKFFATHLLCGVGQINSFEAVYQSATWNANITHSDGLFLED